MPTMQRALSTHAFVAHRLTTVWLDRVWDAGIPLVEIFCARQHLDYRNRAQVAELGYWFRESPLQLHSLHAPMYTDEVWGRSGPDAVLDITEPVKAKRLQVVDEIKRALEIAETIPFRYLIQHIGVKDAEYSERATDSAFAALERMKQNHMKGLPPAEQRQFKAAIEVVRAATLQRNGKVLAAAFSLIKSLSIAPARNVAVATVLRNQLARR